MSMSRRDDREAGHLWRVVFLIALVGCSWESTEQALQRDSAAIDTTSPDLPGVADAPRLVALESSDSTIPDHARSDLVFANGDTLVPHFRSRMFIGTRLPGGGPGGVIVEEHLEPDGTVNERAVREVSLADVPLESERAWSESIEQQVADAVSRDACHELHGLPQYMF